MVQIIINGNNENVEVISGTERYRRRRSNEYISYRSYSEAHRETKASRSIEWDDWVELIEIIEKGDAVDRISNGSTTSIMFEDYTKERLKYVMQVNTYGLGEVDFIPQAAYFEKPYKRSDEDFSLIKWLNTDFYKDIHPRIRAAIVPKESQMIWLPKEVEVFGTAFYGSEEDEERYRQYPIFKKKSGRMLRDADGDPADWWLSSPDVSSAAGFCSVSADGAPDGDDASFAYGVCPCFRIAPS